MDIAARLGAGLRQLGQLLGLLTQSPEAFLRGSGSSDASDDEIEALIQRRNDARDNKDWAEADRVRDQLQALGVVLEDGAGGTSWRRA